ncbi:hypothetical protein NC651_001548 [Populus alba x Populus x berolinensis]|nr:hypothetical protein NC651_001548 [Populus alba x Populus x berolinensis]
MGCLRVISPLKRLSLLQISRFRSFLKVVYLQDFNCMLHNFESSSKRDTADTSPPFRVAPKEPYPHLPAANHKKRLERRNLAKLAGHYLAG